MLTKTEEEAQILNIGLVIYVRSLPEDSLILAIRSQFYADYLERGSSKVMALTTNSKSVHLKAQ